MASSCQWSARAAWRVQRRCDPVLHDLEVHVWTGPAPSNGLAESLIKLARLDWRMPDYSALSRRQKTLSVAIAARRSSAGLHLLIDSTGVKMLGEGEWKTKKHGAVDFHAEVTH